jgi:hypothetical protein
MTKRNRIICEVPGKLKELIVKHYRPSGNWHRDKSLFAVMVKHYITFPSRFFIPESDPELERVLSAFEKKEVEEVGFSLSEFDFNHLQHVSDICFRSITQQSALALCSMALYIKKNKIKSYRIGDDLKINFTSN